MGPPARLAALMLATGLATGACGSAPEEVAAPAPTVTTTVTAEPASTPTVTVTAPAAPAPTVTVTATQTVEEEVAASEVEPEAGPGQESVYYENCDAARAAGAAPVRRGEPGYASHLDRDDDGIAANKARASGTPTEEGTMRRGWAAVVTLTLALSSCGGTTNEVSRARGGDGEARGSTLDRSVCRETGSKVADAGSVLGGGAEGAATLDDAAAALGRAKAKVDEDLPLAEDPSLRERMASLSTALGRLRVALLQGGDVTTAADGVTAEIDGFRRACAGIV